MPTRLVTLSTLLVLSTATAICSSALCSPEETSAASGGAVRPATGTELQSVGVDPLSRNFMAPTRADFLKPDQAGLDYEEVYFANQQGELLRAWLLPAEDARQTIVFCMGNTGNISAMLMYARILHQGGFEVLLFDYQGYGGSSGMATAMSLPGDALSAFDYVHRTRQRESADIGLFGVSLGSILALMVAAERNAGAVAVEDVFLPARMVAEMRHLMPDDLATRMAISGIQHVVLPRVDPLQTVPRLTCPMFLLHGEHDRLLPPTATLEVSSVARGPVRVWFMQDAGHAPETLEVNDREYAGQLQRFFREAFTGTLNEPVVTMEATAARYVADSDIDAAAGNDAAEDDSGRQYSVRVTVQVASELHQAGGEEFQRPIQVAVGSQDGRFEFARPLVSERKTVELLVPFVPVHVSAIVFEHVDLVSADEWVPSRSELSRSLSDFKELLRELANSCPIKLSEPDEHGRRRLFRQPGDWDWLCSRLPSPETIHPHIRPRYAKLLAAVALRIVGHEENRAGLTAETLLPYLPDSIEEYYELHNAGFQLGFHDDSVFHCMQDLCRIRATQDQLQESRRLLRLSQQVRPPYRRSIHLSDEEIESAACAKDIERLLSLLSDKKPQ